MPQKIPILLKETLALFYKEVLLEWRERYALNGLLLYIVSTVFVCYLSFSLKTNQLNPITWNTLFWIILLFTAINAVGKSFSQEQEGRLLYYYSLVSPHSIILSKILYNSLLLSLIAGIGLVFYGIVLGNPVQDFSLFLLNILLGTIGFSSTLTMVSSIAAKAENNATLMAVLSFPIIIPMLLMLVRISLHATDGLERGLVSDEIWVLLAINMIVFSLSLLLFPYLWRS